MKRPLQNGRRSVSSLTTPLSLILKRLPNMKRWTEALVILFSYHLSDTIQHVFASSFTNFEAKSPLSHIPLQYISPCIIVILIGNKNVKTNISDQFGWISDRMHMSHVASIGIGLTTQMKKVHWLVWSEILIGPILDHWPFPSRWVHICRRP